MLRPARIIGELAYYVPPIKFSLIFYSRDLSPMWKMSLMTTNVDSINGDPQVIRSLTYVKCLKNVTNLELKHVSHLFTHFRAAYDSTDRHNLYIAMK
jgi:hypothetical protein